MGHYTTRLTWNKYLVSENQRKGARWLLTSKNLFSHQT